MQHIDLVRKKVDSTKDATQSCARILDSGIAFLGGALLAP